ncbi:MAG: hypothetical protein R2710_02520 [Acidimicrobiales bacterium]
MTLLARALDKAITVLATGDQAVAADLLASDDEIDAMHVSHRAVLRAARP